MLFLLFCFCVLCYLKRTMCMYVQCAWFRSRFCAHSTQIDSENEFVSSVNKPKLWIFFFPKKSAGHYFVCCALTFKHFKSSKNSNRIFYFVFGHNIQPFNKVPSICELSNCNYFIKLLDLLPTHEIV